MNKYKSKDKYRKYHKRENKLNRMLEEIFMELDRPLYDIM